GRVAHCNCRRLAIRARCVPQNPGQVSPLPLTTRIPTRGKFSGMKICSLLPSATKILFALGLGDQVVGVSHECDFPPEARQKPVLIRSRITHTKSPAAIDRQVREFLERGESLYSVDLDAL